jgi:hypothetical protein
MTVAFCYVLLAVGLWSPPAHAYLDPAMGSMLLQGLLGGIAGVMVIGRLYWRRIKEFVGFTSPAPPSGDNVKVSRSKH